MEHVNYQIIDNMCEAALIDLNYHEDQNTWLHEHKFFSNIIYIILMKLYLIRKMKGKIFQIF